MAFADAGFDGTVDEVQFAKMLNRYAVVGPDDFKASNVAGADRTLSVANGTALGPGTLNVGTAFSPIQFDAVTSGTSRWDLVVLRRDWQPPGGLTELKVIKGGATQTLPARNQNPGVIDDQPLYLQQVNAGSTSLGTRIDLRVWVGAGGAEVVSSLALSYLAAPGAQIRLGGVEWRYSPGDNEVWGWTSYPAGDTDWRTMSTTLGFTPLLTSGWSGVKYRVTNGTVFVNGAVNRSAAWPNDYTCCVMPALLAPNFKTQGFGCQVNPNGNVELPAGSGSVSFSASWPIRRG